MDFNQYAYLCAETDLAPGVGPYGAGYHVIKLGGEFFGELFPLLATRKDWESPDILDEFGDCWWYLARLWALLPLDIWFPAEKFSGNGIINTAESIGLFMENYGKCMRDGTALNQNIFYDVFRNMTFLTLLTGASLSDVWTRNINKAQGRKERNTIKGSGHNR